MGRNKHQRARDTEREEARSDTDTATAVAEPKETPKSAPKRGTLPEFEFPGEEPDKPEPDEMTKKISTLRDTGDGNLEIPDDEPEPKPEADAPDADDKTEPEPEPVKWDKKLLERAATLGIDEDEAKSFLSPEHLVYAIGMAQRMADARQKPAEEPAKAEPESKPEPKPQPKVDDGEPDFSFETPKPEPENPFEDEEAPKANERLLKTMRQSHEYTKKQLASRDRQISELGQAVRFLGQMIQQQQSQAHVEKFDALVQSVGDDYADSLGKGSIFDMDPDSDTYKARMKLGKTMTTLARGYGDEAPPLAVLFRKALALEYADKQKQILRKQIGNQMRTRTGQFTSRPTQREETPVDEDPTKTAKRKWQEKARALGIDV